MNEQNGCEDGLIRKNGNSVSGPEVPGYSILEAHCHSRPSIVGGIQRSICSKIKTWMPAGVYPVPDTGQA
jgi:hypothetical protein